MDDRTRRIGEHAIGTQPAWVILSLGEPPADPAERQHWQQRPATIGACGELSGRDAVAGAQVTRRQWAALTEPTRRMALAADLELRRHPDAHFKPLQGAGPAIFNPRC